MSLIGLTGGIGAGKSTVARLLAERGAVVVDADRLARDVLRPGTAGLAEVVEAFGDDLVVDGELDRKALAARVFDDPHAVARLNEIVHPRVAELTRQAVAATPPGSVVVHDIPLLVETGAAGRYDFVVVVEAPELVRLARLLGDGMTEADALARIAAQASEVERREVADLVIDNAGTYEELVAQVHQAWPAIAEAAR